MRLAVLLVLWFALPAHAEMRAASTALTLARNKGKPIRVLAKQVQVESVDWLTPCTVRLVVVPQHPQFQRFSIDVTYLVTATGAIENGRAPIKAEILPAGSTESIATRRGEVSVTRRKPHDFDAKLTAAFDHGGVAWTLAATVRLTGSDCLWDMH
ncbi:hypothetical protein BH11MYX3_BH11MYX3_17190 [soil metagenome]